jgi:uncharacterized Zn finger protein
MICTQCGDLIVEDRFMEWSARWRCLKCGHVQDSLSVERFLKKHQKTVSAQSTEHDYFEEEVHLGSESLVGGVIFRRPRNEHKL